MFEGNESNFKVNASNIKSGYKWNNYMYLAFVATFYFIFLFTSKLESQLLNHRRWSTILRSYS